MNGTVEAANKNIKKIIQKMVVTLFKALLSKQANKSLYHFLILDKKGENGEYFVLTHNQKIVREVFYFIFFIAEYSTQGEPSF